MYDLTFFDSGTTTRHMVECMAHLSQVTVLTANLDFIASALPYDNVHVICLAGALNRTTISLVGAMAAKTLEQFNINKAFMASTGISLEKGATNFYADEFELKQTAMRQSQKKFLLVDKMKLGVVSMQTYAELREFERLITDAPLPDQYQDYLTQHGCAVSIADEK